MPELKIRKPSRQHVCDVVKCRRLTHNLIARGDDASRSSLHICDGCIDDMFYRLHPGYKDVITAWEAGDLVERADDGRWPDEPDDGLLPDETDAEPAGKNVTFAPAVVDGTLAGAPKRGRKAKTE